MSLALLRNEDRAFHVRHSTPDSSLSAKRHPIFFMPCHRKCPPLVYL